MLEYGFIGIKYGFSGSLSHEHAFYGKTEGVSFGF
jgi:hypothetical protein